MLGDGTGNFTGARYFNHGIIPTSAGSIAAGDFNHDGNPDVVMADCCNPRLSIMLGDGQGSLGPPRLVPLAGLSGALRAVAVGDFDGDGHPDLAVADSIDKIAILLGNGDGTFRPAGTFPAGSRPSICDRCLAVGDFNRDGKPDLVIGLSLGAPSFQMGVSVLLGNGDGTFQPPRLITIAEQGQGTSIAVGDFNGDGKPDLAVASATSTDLFILLGDGNGGFVLPPRRLSLGAGAAASAVAVGDFNGDGKEDLAVTTGASTVVIFIGNGDGTFQLPGRSFPLVPLPGGVSVSRSIQVGDFNGDGRLDLAVLNRSGVSIFLGDGQGNFPARLEYGAELIPTALAVSDFNSDGKSDVALTSGGQSGTLSLLLSFPDSSPGAYSRLVRETGSVCGASFAFTRTMKDGTKIHFNADGQHLATVDRNSNTTCYRYNADGTLASITDPVGLATMLTYTDGHLSSVRDPAGRVTTFTIDEAGNLTTITDPTKAVAQYAYDDDHHLVARTDPRDFTFNYRYNFAGRFESSLLPDGSTRRVSAAQMAGLVDPASGRGTRQNPAPHTLTSAVTSRYTDGNNNTTIYTMDSLGGATSSTDAENRRTESLRDGNGNPTKITEANGAVTLKTYDVRGNLLSSTNRAINATTTFTYEPRFNQRTSVRDPRGNTTRFEYDAGGNQVAIVDALNNRTTMTYDTRGLLVRVRQDGLGQPTTFTYDANGNLLTSTDPLGNVATREYDDAGNIRRSIDAEGRATVYSYDPMNRLTSFTDARGGVTRYTYMPGCCGGSTGLLSSITDAEGRTTTFEYGTMGRLASITNPLKQTQTFIHDSNGNLISATDAQGRTATFEYDRANQLIRKIRPAPESTIEYRYDRLGNLEEVRESNNASVVTMGHDGARRLTSVSTAGTILPAGRITYEYDSVGNRTRMVDPQGGATLYVYDELNRPTRLTNPRSQIATFAYDRLSRRTQLNLANGTSTTYSYDDANELTSLVTRRADTTIANLQYTYDRVRNRRTMTETAGRNTYTYDEIYQLTNATHPQEFNPEELFTYDGVGNRLTSHLSETYVYDEANRLLQDDQFNYTYDADGNLIAKEEIANGSVTTYSYNSENQLTRIGFPDGTSAVYDYDGLGRRIRKNVNGVITKYVYDNGDILLELDGSNNIVARYTHGPKIDEPLSMDRGGQSSFYHADGLGSIVMLTDSAGSVVRSYIYDSFGNVVQQTGSLANSYTYTARELDAESGLFYYRARYYDPKTGRFLQKDPIIPIKRMNWYVYVENNPINLTDPSGRDVCEFITRLVCEVACVVVCECLEGGLSCALVCAGQAAAGGCHKVAEWVCHRKDKPQPQPPADPDNFCDLECLKRANTRLGRDLAFP
jgi:RHS repeat-associated protein